jgi:hypothetical protein
VGGREKIKLQKKGIPCTILGQKGEEEPGRRGTRQERNRAGGAEDVERGDDG